MSFVDKWMKCHFGNLFAWVFMGFIPFMFIILSKGQMQK